MNLARTKLRIESRPDDRVVWFLLQYQEEHLKGFGPQRGRLLSCRLAMTKEELARARYSVAFWWMIRKLYSEVERRVEACV